LVYTAHCFNGLTEGEKGECRDETELFYRGILPFLLLKREVETLIVVYSALLLLPGLPKPVAEKLLK
jgi:hypothetical protein